MKVTDIDRFNYRIPEYAHNCQTSIMILKKVYMFIYFNKIMALLYMLTMRGIKYRGSFSNS